MANKEQKLICPYPFGRLSASSKDFVPCCLDWLDNSPQIRFQENEDPWNGKAAQNFRQKILVGDYSLCKRELCKEPLIDLNEVKESYITDDVNVSYENLAAAKLGNTILPVGPTIWSVGSSDNRCNLRCPSCRDNFINKLTKKRRREFINHFENLKKYRNDIEVLRFGDNGEVFFSPWLKRILKIATTKNFPNLKEVRILSNGTLITEKQWRRLSPGTDNISQINISIDAGTKESYQKTRGGNFENLLKNLSFIGGLRKANEIGRFYINMTLQIDNLYDFEELIKIAKDNHVDNIIIHPLHNWSMDESTYKSRAVHIKGHAKHGDYLEIISKHRHNPLINFKLP